MQPDERAAKGLFLAFQYPLEIPGVATMTFLRTALNAQRKKRGEAELSTPEFMKLVREAAGKLEIDTEMLRRGVNVGFSGGEKKRNEILQMALLEPRLCVLDETDSGLDIDALKIVVRRRQPAALAGSRHGRHHPLPAAARTTSCRTSCTCSRRGRIVKTGGKELALELEAKGYARIPGRGRARRHERRTSAPMKTQAEQALADAYAAAQGQAAGRPQGRGAARGRVRPLRRARPAAPARRGVEIHRSARADARGQAARRPRPTPRPRRAPRTPASCSATSTRGASCSSTARSCRNCPTSPICRPA